MSAPHTPVTPVLRVADLEAARRFHVHALGCKPIRGTAERLELELFGEPLVLVADGGETPESVSTAVFVLGVDDWCTTSERLRVHGIDTVVEPGRRFSVVPGEQCSMRLEDPDGNVIELRGFATEADQLAA